MTRPTSEIQQGSFRMAGCPATATQRGAVVLMPTVLITRSHELKSAKKLLDTGIDDVALGAGKVGKDSGFAVVLD